MNFQIVIRIQLLVFFLLTQSVNGQTTSEQSNNGPFLQLPTPGGQLDTNIFNTNGLILPKDVQILIQDLQLNISQLTPLLSILNGENPTSNAGGPGSSSIINPQPASGSPVNSVQNFGQNLGRNSGKLTGSAPVAAGSPGTNGMALVYALGAVLEDMQADLQELLPRLASIAGHTNYSNGAGTMRGSRAPRAGGNGDQNGSSGMPVSKRPL